MDLKQYTSAAFALRIMRAYTNLLKLLRHCSRNRCLRPLVVEAITLRARIVRGESSTAELMHWLLQSADHVQVWLELTAFDVEVAQVFARDSNETTRWHASTQRP